MFVKAVREGTIDSLVLQNPFRMGSEAVKAVLANLEGENVNKRIDTGVTLVSQENIDLPEIRALIK